MKKPYRFLAILHSGKVCKKELSTKQDVEAEIKRESNLRQYYRSAHYEQRNGKIVTVAF